MRNRSGHEELIAFWIDAIIRDATLKGGAGMVCGKLRTKKSGCGTIRKFATLAAMVSYFIEEYRPGELGELRSFQTDEKGLTKALLERAALARDSHGKRYAHQRRLTRDSLISAHEALRAKLGRLQKAGSFDEVWDLVRDATSEVAGIGELYHYDTALRIAAACRHAPEDVCLHAGTRIGAKRLGIRTDRERVLMSELPTELHRLQAHEVESFLCIFKNQLGAATQRRA
ncbi:hypothetical protein OIN59_21190 [Acidovorax sp. D2M1]|uniref:Uncharacterized protein n=1 Tax=Acidovorax benzenivorans TaxID=2987520 RepID=A0ABT5S3S0_9BURK|nr:hypothetical protein [Acidovorax benzenivorans]MDD2179962.1 hypothetical protein [Acidovorax benzenivorans]